MRKTTAKLVELFRAKDNLIFVNTYEENEFIREVCGAISALSKDGTNFKVPRNVYVYSRTRGLSAIDLMSPIKYDPESVVKSVKNHMDALRYIESIQNPMANRRASLMDEIRGDGGKNSSNNEDGTSAILIMKDMHLFFQDKDFIRLLRDMKEEYGDGKVYCPIIITAPVMELPPELEKIFTIFDFSLMDKDEVRADITPLVRQVNCINRCEDPEKVLNDITNACVGLTTREIRRALGHSLAKNNKRKIDAADIHEEKLQIIKKSNALDYVEPTHGIDDLGGCDNFKEWIYRVKEAITPEAKAFGIPQPKGAMLVGVPGTSKTVSAEILASYLNVPLVSLDMSKIMGSLVGQSERQVANALRIAKSVAPCVLLIDECEKIFGGFASSASCDAGTLSRVMGQLLTFLNNDETGVITIMTSNDVSILPPELTRSGRIDAQWMFDLPYASERKEIISIYLKKNNLECGDKELEYMIEHSENFTGAEIRSAVKDMLVNSFYRQKTNGVKEFTRKLTISDIQEALDNTVTVYRSSREKIEAFRKIAANRYLNASLPENRKIEKKPAARVTRSSKPNALFSFMPNPKSGQTVKKQD